MSIDGIGEVTDTTAVPLPDFCDLMGDRTSSTGDSKDPTGTIISGGGLTGTLLPWSVHWRPGDP